MSLELSMHKKSSLGFRQARDLWCPQIEPKTLCRKVAVKNWPAGQIIPGRKIYDTNFICILLVH